MNCVLKLCFSIIENPIKPSDIGSDFFQDDPYCEGRRY